MKFRLLTVAAFASVLLAGCASKQGLPVPTASEVELADREARETADELGAAIPANLVRKPLGPVHAPQVKDLPEDVVRGKWNTDRSRLRTCVATHGSLVSELTVRNLLIVPEVMQ